MGRRTTSLYSSDGITHPKLMDEGCPFLQEYNNSAPELKQRASSYHHFHLSLMNLPLFNMW